MNRISIYISLIFFLIGSFAFSQNHEIQSRLDTNHILIGDQANYIIDVKYPSSSNVEYPILSDTINENIEIVELKIDTISSLDNIHYQFNYTITSFDSGYYVIPPQKMMILDNGDSLESQALIFAVSTYQIDSTQTKIFDIKEPIEAPWTVAEFLEENYPYMLVGLLIIAVILLIIWLLRKRKLAEKEPKKIIIPKEAAHIIAFRDLNTLKEKKLWQNDRVKMYYVELSDIVRTYIENRYRLLALESTSQELIDSITHNKYLSEEQLLMLKQILNTADMAKFAKAKPLANENDLALQNAFKLIEQTQINKSDATEEKEVSDVE